MKNPMDTRLDQLQHEKETEENGLLAQENYEHEILSLLSDPPMYDDLADLLNITKALANVTTLVQNTIIFHHLTTK